MNIKNSHRVKENLHELSFPRIKEKYTNILPAVTNSNMVFMHIDSFTASETLIATFLLT